MGHKETLSSLHRKKMYEINQEESTLQTLIEQIQTLERQMSLVKDPDDPGPKPDGFREWAFRKHELQKEIDRIKSARMNYLLKNSELLFQHTESEKDRKAKIHGMKILKKAHGLESTEQSQSQKDSMLSAGKAMSRAPIIKGIA
jgi:hypothetical protein